MAISALEDPPDSFVPREHEPELPGRFGRAMGFGPGAGRTELKRAVLLSLALHVGFAIDSLSSMLDLRGFALLAQDAAQDRFDTQIDITVDEPEAEPEPPPEPEAPPEAPPEAEAPLPEEAPAPAAAEAAAVLTAEPTPDQPLDLTDQGFISGTGTRFAGGVTAADGTATKAVRTVTATAQGVVGGGGTVPPAPAPAVDRSQPASPVAGDDWSSCPFPAEADAEQQNQAVVRLVVAVGTDGRPSSVSVLSNPGFGFGQAARQCALRKRYTPGRDAAGNPAAKSTPPFRVRFRR